MDRGRLPRIAIGALLVLAIGSMLAGSVIYSHRLSHPSRDAGDVRVMPTPEASDPVVAWIGDSYTAGTGATPGADFVDLVSRELGWRSANLGEGGTGYSAGAGGPGQPSGVSACGEEYCPSYREVIPRAAETDPDIVIVSGGRNDAGLADQSAVAKAVRTFFRQLREAVPHARVFVTSPIGDDDAIPTNLATLIDVVRRAALASGATYLDIGQPLLGHRDRVIDDGVHPNDAGYRAIASAIERAYRAQE